LDLKERADGITTDRSDRSTRLDRSSQSSVDVCRGSVVNEDFIAGLNVLSERKSDLVRFRISSVGYWDLPVVDRERRDGHINRVIKSLVKDENALRLLLDSKLE